MPPLPEGLFVALFVAFVASALAAVVAQTLFLLHLRRHHRRRWQELGEPGFWVGSWSPGAREALQDAVSNNAPAEPEDTGNGGNGNGAESGAAEKQSS